jgi:hypothetical protein
VNSALPSSLRLLLFFLPFTWGRHRRARATTAWCLLPVWVRAHYVLKEEFFASGMLAMTNHRQVQFLPEMKAG